jgi:nucleotide-binding universal stress UspA family protein
MFQRILVPLDGSPTAEKVLDTAIGEARAHDSAVIVLLRVIAPLRSSFMVSIKVHDELARQATEAAETYLLAIARRLQAERAEVETAIAYGPPAEEILAFAEKTSCDLIVMGSRGETSSLRWRFGGTAGKVVRTPTEMPVLVITT